MDCRMQAAILYIYIYIFLLIKIMSDSITFFPYIIELIMKKNVLYMWSKVWKHHYF